MVDNPQQQEERPEVNEINIEICTNCSQHQTHTRHNEQTYIKLFTACKSSIESQITGIQVVKNGNIKPGYQPLLGAFEISCNGILIYSKIKTGLWPQPTLVAARVKNFVDDYKAGKSVKHYAEIKEKKIIEEKRVISPSTVYGNFYSPMKSSDEKKSKQIQEQEDSQFNMQQENEQVQSPKEKNEEINPEPQQSKSEKKIIDNQIEKPQQEEQEQEPQQEHQKQQQQHEQQQQEQQEQLQEPIQQKEEVQQSQPQVEKNNDSVIPEKNEEDKKQDIEEKPKAQEEEEEQQQQS